MTLQSERLLLRSFTEADLENVYRGLSHPDVIRHYGVSYDSREATREQMAWFAAPAQCWWAICSAEDGTFYGAGGLNDVSAEHRKAEIGLWLLPDHWGRGIMGEALPLICDHGFTRLGLHRIEGFVESGNANCKRALAKLDFVHEGKMRECEVKDGALISVDIYARLARPGGRKPIHPG